MDSAWLIWSGLFSVIGMAVFVYGKRQRLGAPLLIGLALMIYPYFVSGTLAVVGIGVLLLAGLYVGNRFEQGG